MLQEVGAFLNDVYARADVFLFGRRTYEIFAGSWVEHVVVFLAPN
jgi:hypothetical protein